MKKAHGTYQRPINYFLRYELSVTSKSFRMFSAIREKPEYGCTDVTENVGSSFEGSTGAKGAPPPAITYLSAVLNDQGCYLKEHLYSRKITEQ